MPAPGAGRAPAQRGRVPRVPAVHSGLPSAKGVPLEPAAQPESPNPATAPSDAAHGRFAGASQGAGETGGGWQSPSLKERSDRH